MLESVVNFVWVDAAGNEVLLASDGFAALEREPRPEALEDQGRLEVIAAPVSNGDVEAICRGLGVDGWDAPEVTHHRRAAPRTPHPFLWSSCAACSRRSRRLTSAEALAAGWSASRPPAARGDRPGAPPPRPARARAQHPQGVGHTPSRARSASRAPPRASPRGPSATGGPAPTIGQHTDEILAEIGLGQLRRRAARGGRRRVGRIPSPRSQSVPLARPAQRHEAHREDAPRSTPRGVRRIALAAGAAHRRGSSRPPGASWSTSGGAAVGAAVTRIASNGAASGQPR